MLSISPTLQAKVTSRISVEDRGYKTPCWISNRAAQPNGYTKLGYLGTTWLTHRFAYTVFLGPVPNGLQLDHLCRQRACCNPTHLEPVTARENILRGDLVKPECLRGHPLSGPNLYPRPDNPQQRGCRACRAETQRRRAA